MIQTFKEGTIEELCNVEYGTRVVRKKDAGTIYPVYGGGGETFFLDTFNRQDRVVIARFAMSEKCTRRVNGKFALNDSGLTLSPKDHAVLRQDYLDYYVLSINDQIYESARGTAQKNLDVPAFRQMRITYPVSLEKQSEIVERLDSAFSEIDLLERNNEEGNTLNSMLLKAKINSEFKAIWSKETSKTLGEYSKISYGYTAKSSISYKGPKYLRITDIQNKSVNWQDVPNCEISKEEKSKFALKIGDIVFARTGATTGKSFLIDEDVDSVFASYLIRVRPESDILVPEFLYYFFQSAYYWDEIAGGISGSAQGGFNASKLQAMRICIPAEKRIQEEIVRRIRDFEVELSSRTSQLLKRSSFIPDLRNSLLSGAFTQEQAVA